jgi:hypothetical protein
MDGVRSVTDMTEGAGGGAPVSRLWLLPMVALLAVVVGAVELAYLRWPIPPGVDPGDWIQRSYAWVGLPAVDPDAVGSPYLYPPVMFPLIGVTYRITGSPLTTGFVFGGTILVLFGLSAIHLARRYLSDGTAQLLFVGLAVLNGTTLQMLFWGGYPNFLALAIANEALVFLLAFSQSRGTRDGLVFYGLLALVYLTHDLTFIVLVVTVAGAFLLWTLQDRHFPKILVSRGSLLGIPLLIGTIVAYSLAIRLAHIQTPGYFGSNPAAYNLDNLGGFFRPLNSAPMFLPAGPSVNLDPGVVVVLLGGAAVAAFFGVVLLERLWRRKDPRWTIAGSFLAAVLAIPVVGWLAHIDTDYTRFVYFLPVPLALGLGLASEPLLNAYVSGTGLPPVPTDGRGSESDPTPPPGAGGWEGRSPSARRIDGAVVVGILVILLFAGVTWPMIASNEQADAGPAHDAAFLASLQYLKDDHSPGAVLTLQSTVRWVEAVDSRGAFDVGPTWLLFEPWQIVDAEESYWAFNSRYTLTNNLDALAFSGGYTGVDQSPLVSAPLYAAYVDGVAIPILNLQTAGILVSSTVGGVARADAPGAWGAPTLTVSANGSASATLAFHGPYFNLSEVSTAHPAGGATLAFQLTPEPGTVLRGIQLNLSAPSTSVVLLHGPASAGVSRIGDRLYWNVSTVIGPNPSASIVPATVDMSPAPSSVVLSSARSPNSALLTFPDASGGSWAGWLNLSTAGTGNPAVTLPPVMDTAQFLQEHQIRFLLLPTKAVYLLTGAYYQLLFGWKTVYSNAEWTVVKV